MALRYNDKLLSGNLNGVTANSVVPGNTLNLGDNTRLKVRNLAAYLTYTAATATITIACKWQVSNDGSTWIDFANGSQNAAAVVLATGTSAASSKAIPAPDGVYGWRFARIALVTGVVTGGAADVYTMGYGYRTGPANFN